MSSHSLTSNISKLEKEKQKLVQEKCQALLNEMLRDEDNKYCVDCDAKGPRWASWNLGIFLCIRCAGIHRNLGVHISRVKSVNLDTWTPEQVVTIQQMGNSRGRAVYEANLPDTFRRPQTDSALEQFIRAKYEHNKYIAKEWVKPSPAKVNWDAEIEEYLRKKKESKKHHGSTGDIGPLPAPKTSTTPAPVRLPTPSTASAVTPDSVKKTQAKELPKPIVQVTSTNTAANDDLLGLSLGVGSGELIQQLPTTPATNQDDLGSLFLTPEGSGIIDFGSGSTSSQKLTKESILSLYGPSPAGNTPVGGVNVNPFLNPYPQQQQGQSSSLFGGSPNVYSNQIGAQFPTPTQVPNQPPNIPNVGIPDYMFGSFQQSTQPTVQNLQDPLQNQFFGLNLGNPMPTIPQPNQFGNMVQNGTHSQHHPGILGIGLQQPQVGLGGGLGNLMGMNMNMGSTGFNKMSPGTNLPGLGTSVNQLLMKPNGALAHTQPSPAAATASLSLGDIWK